MEETKQVSWMAVMCLTLITQGAMTLETVPPMYREEVEYALSLLGK